MLLRHLNFDKSISPYSGHYRPTDDSLDNFLSFLNENGVNLDEIEVPEDQAYYFPSMVGTQDSMYVLVPHDKSYYFPSMVGTEDNMSLSAWVCTMETPDNIGSTSGMVNNISSQSSTVPSLLDPNAPFYF
ncbi:IQ domain-containing protein IQM3 [Camellia lanceoleosa]|uniref:IQ domain-containing protein IQM3 n=1 Tax=Camellia lanceoleosa TaxID=1840588 RepID=A0ACC0GWM3_9ERIC|nr:IQ domain-containing protein IQM3 [Camellia lanceoleosa]